MDRRDVVVKAVEILASVGLPDLTMRRIGTELGVQQSALYHHFANKQALLGAVADEIVARGPRSAVPDGAGWRTAVVTRCTDLRAALLSCPDGADVVASMFAFGIGGRAPYDDLVVMLNGHVADDVVPAAARTLLHYVHGHAIAQQAHEQAASLGAIETPAVADDFTVGLTFVVDGIAAHAAGSAS